MEPSEPKLLDTQLRTWYRVDPPRRMRASGYRWEHEVRVALPPSYESTTTTYPVLWITDNMLETALTALHSPRDLILVAVGPQSSTFAEAGARREYDFTPSGDLFWSGATGDYVRALWTEFGAAQEPGGAEQVLSFLVDHVRPILAANYRMDPEDHGIIGASSGGTFVAYALFARPGAFRRYICGSPNLYMCSNRVFELEAEYASTHNDLAADVFLAAGEGELTEEIIAPWGCVSSMAKLAETLSMRRYPSLRLEARVLHDETHATIWPPLITHGVHSVWRDVDH
jgi:predicted alpha/beta superfamily hydrolase